MISRFMILDLKMTASALNKQADDKRTQSYKESAKQPPCPAKKNTPQIRIKAKSPLNRNVLDCVN